MLKVRVGYPTRDAEKEIVARMASGRPIEVQRVAEADDILAARSGIAELFMDRSEEHTSELQSRQYLVCRLLLEKKKTKKTYINTQHANNTMYNSTVTLT